MAEKRKKRGKKKGRWIFFGLLLGVLCIVCVNQMQASASLTGEKPGGNHLYSKYPMERYMLDSYVDTSGNWMPWNWGKAVDDGMYSVLAFLTSCTYVSVFKFFSVVSFLVQAVYSIDVIDPLLDTVVRFVQKTAGFDGRFLKNGLFSQLLAVMVILAGLYYGFQVIKKETGETISGIFTFSLLVILSLGFFYQADFFIKGANQAAMDIQSVVVRAGTNALGIEGNPAAAIREGFFDITVYQPYLLLQYNDTEVTREKAEELLKLESGSEEREALVKQEVENGNRMMNGWYGLSMRLQNLLPLILSGGVLAFVILLLVGMNIYHQLVFLLYVCFTPFVLILSLLPGKMHLAVQFLGKIFYELCMRIALAMLLCLLYGFSSAVFSMTGSEGYLVGAVLQAILYLAVFLFRKNIYALFTDRRPEKKKGGIRKAVGTFYMVNRGVKAAGALAGRTEQVQEPASLEEPGENRRKGTSVGTRRNPPQRQPGPGSIKEEEGLREGQILAAREREEAGKAGNRKAKAETRSSKEKVLPAQQKKPGETPAEDGAGTVRKKTQAGGLKEAGQIFAASNPEAQLAGAVLEKKAGTGGNRRNRLSSGNSGSRTAGVMQRTKIQEKGAMQTQRQQLPERKKQSGETSLSVPEKKQNRMLQNTKEKHTAGRQIEGISSAGNREEGKIRTISKPDQGEETASRNLARREEMPESVQKLQTETRPEPLQGAERRLETSRREQRKSGAIQEIRQAETIRQPADGTKKPAMRGPARKTDGENQKTGKKEPARQN